jgi:30S ribosomal protein S31
LLTRTGAFDFNSEILLLPVKKLFIMGKGDRKTKKGKIFKGSFGKSRPAKIKKKAAAKKESK